LYGQDLVIIAPAAVAHWQLYRQRGEQSRQAASTDSDFARNHF
jgi:hypothetical protein